MYFLGVHGWDSREHDPAACLVRDGEIISMAEEERFNRKKRAFNCLPVNAALFCLAESKITLDDVDYVCVGLDRRKVLKLKKLKKKLSDQDILDKFFPKKYFSYQKPPKLILLNHHLSHAASVFFSSGFKESAILVIDGQGEDCSSSIFYGNGNKIKLLRKFPINYSLGYFYESVNQHIGFQTLESGKTMGLAPYGKPVYKFPNIILSKTGVKIYLPDSRNFDVDCLDDQKPILRAWRQYFNQRSIEKFYPKGRSIKTEIPQASKNLAASAQQSLENAVSHLAKLALETTGSKNLCISGGVALNCAANSQLLLNKKIQKIFIFPCSNDAGVSAGAALYASRHLIVRKKICSAKLKSVYLGPNYSSLDIKKVLDEKNIKYKTSKNIYKEIAFLLSKDKVIGWFQDKMEIGPRALGNRSIIASPLKKSMWEKVNLVKGRELWRPLAPSILEEYKKQYFENAKNSPFMLFNFVVKKEKRREIPAVVHIDGSTRPQTVSKKKNLKFWRLINEFRKIAGVPIILNTSFNGPGEPIVCSPSDALNTFFSSGLDVLVMNNLIILKNNSK